jgi:tRNA (guanine-N7-)-methyltransferase
MNDENRSLASAQVASQSMVPPQEVVGEMTVMPQLKSGNIRSYVLRPGRLTAGQKHALDRGLPIYGLDAEKPFDLFDAFGLTDKQDQVKPKLVVEIGFGNGASLVEMAQASPDICFVGIEVHTPGVGAILQGIEAAGIENLRIYFADAHLVLTQAMASAQVDRFQLYFPDPWPKKRHHKRRFVRSDLMQLVCVRLRPGGLFHMATDWEPYAEDAKAFLNSFELFENSDSNGGFVPRPDWRPTTKFERRGLKLGHGVWDLLYRRR